MRTQQQIASQPKTFASTKAGDRSVEELFGEMDADGNGVIDREEFDKVWASMSNQERQLLLSKASSSASWSIGERCEYFSKRQNQRFNAVITDIDSGTGA